MDVSGLYNVLMKVSWVKQSAQGQITIRKDRHGFWICKLNEREDSRIENPYVFPTHVSQVFFIQDSRDPTWSIVLSHEPRSKRIVGEKDK